MYARQTVKIFAAIVLLVLHCTAVLRASDAGPQALCNASATLALGRPYDPTVAFAVPIDGSLTVVCFIASGRAATASANAGAIALAAGRSGDPRHRHMTSGGNRLAYDVCVPPTTASAAGCAVSWGDGTAGTSVFLPGPLKLGVTTFPIHGVAFAGQSSAPAGDYADDLLVTTRQ